MIESELLAAIRATPDDEAPRLVYADWLSEHGQSERAELIRVHCEMHRPDTTPERQKELSKRQRVLLATHVRGWVIALGLGPHDVRFVRGLIEEITVPGDRLESLSEEALQQPIRVLTVIPPLRVDALFSLSWLERIERLNLGGLPIAPEVFAALLGSGRLARLRALTLWSSGLGDVGVATLASCGHLRSLEHLDVRHNQIGPAGLRALMEGDPLETLQGLALTGNLLYEEGARLLGQWTRVRSLRRLELGHCGLLDLGTQALAGSELLGALRYLELQANGIGDPGALSLLSSPSLHQLQWLELKYNVLSRSTIGALHQHFGSALSI